jgi:hypothetical protein
MPGMEVMRARARGRPLDLVHAVAGAWGQTEGQEPKLGLCDSATGEVDVDVRMGHLPQIPFTQLWKEHICADNLLGTVMEDAPRPTKATPPSRYSMRGRSGRGSRYHRREE